MSNFDENLFGRVALLSGYVTKEQLDECIEARKSGAGKHVGEVMLSRGLLSSEQFDKIVEVRNKKVRKLLRSQEEFIANDREFARHLLLEGIVDLDDVEGAVLEQQQLKQKNLHFNLAEVLFSRGAVTLSGVKRVMIRQGCHMLRCSLCDFQYRVAEYEEGGKYGCPRCDAVLDPPVVLDPLMVEGVVESKICSTADA